MHDVDLSVIVVNYNTAHLLSEMFSALSMATQGLKSQVILVDNASRDGSQAYIRQHYGSLDLIFNERNVGFGRANNQAVPLIRGQYVLLLNTDAFVSSDSIRKSLHFLEQNPKVGVLGAKLLGRDGQIQASARMFPTPVNSFLSRTGLSRFFPWVQTVDQNELDFQGARFCDWVPGCFYLMPRTVIDRVGLFDPLYFLYCEEVDHCKAVKAAGWQVACTADTSVIHIGGESAKSDGAITEGGRQISELQIESELLYFKKHHGWLGLAAHVLLSFLADAILAFKLIIKGKLKNLRSFAATSVNSQKVLKLLLATAFATRPTR